MPSPDQGAPWLATMRELAGVKEYPGGENNPTILGWARFIGERYPEMSAYSNAYKQDSIPWCGLTMAYCLAKNGIKPPFGDNDLKRYLWANSFATDPALVKTDPRPGAIIVFDWVNGGGHVGVVDRVDGNTIWVAGGNQSDASGGAVTIIPFKRDAQMVGCFWPTAVAAAASPVRTPADVRRRMGKAITLAEAVRDAQGHIKVVAPAVGNGGAYEVAGITVKHHPVAAARARELVESGWHQEAEDFIGDYTGSYTDVADVWTVSWGIEFYLRDSSFHHGPTGAAKIMQRALKLRGEPLDQSGDNRDGIDGDVGPVTAEAMRRQEVDVAAMLTALRQAREDYQTALGFGDYRNGLINRFNNALTVARRFHDEQPKESIPVAEPNTPVANPDLSAILAAVRQTNETLAQLVIALRGTAAPAATAPATQPEAPAATAPAPVVTPPAATPILQQPGMGVAATGLGLSALLQWAGGIDVTQGGSIGQLLPIASGIIGLLSGTGTIGTALNAVSTIAGLISRARQQA